MKNKPRDIPYGGLDANRIKAAKPQMNPEVLEIFKYYIEERYKIHLAKDLYHQPFPWTKDLVLSAYKFTNIRREQDKNSKFLLQLMDLHGNKFTYNMMCNIMLFRMFNKISTYQLTGWVDFENYNEQNIRQKFQEVPKDYVYFTNAYLSSGMKKGINTCFPKESFKVMNIPNIIAQESRQIYDRIKRAQNPEEVIEAFCHIKGVKGFLAYQFFVDLTYLDDFPWSENEFVVSGVGCSLGLSFLFDNCDGLSEEELLFWLRDNCPITKEFCQDLMVDLPWEERYMNIMSLENCLCELGKYIKTIRHMGRPRVKYRVKGANTND